MEAHLDVGGFALHQILPRQVHVCDSERRSSCGELSVYGIYHSRVCGADPGGDLFKLRVRWGKRFVVRGISRSGTKSQNRCTAKNKKKLALTVGSTQNI